jgi:hypothetical protein
MAAAPYIIRGGADAVAVSALDGSAYQPMTLVHLAVGALYIPAVATLIDWECASYGPFCP